MALPEEEAHHAISVVRLRDGERVALFDGKGTEAIGVLARRGKREAVVTIETVRREPQADIPVVLAPAWLHRDKPLEEIVRRGTELGVTSFAFWRAERSQRPACHPDKWQRLAVESCKQSGRLFLPEFLFHDDLSAVLDNAPGCVLAADIEASPQCVHFPPETRDGCLLLIGPEGDFTEEERGLLTSRHTVFVSLGPQVLRTEAAAVALATVALSALGRLGSRLTPFDAGCLIGRDKTDTL